MHSLPFFVTNETDKLENNENVIPNPLEKSSYKLILNAFF